MISNYPALPDQSVEKVTFNHPCRLILVNHTNHHLFPSSANTVFLNYTKETALVQRLLKR